ncbi:MAG: Lrp/AsnC family transcriptional regulator [Paracoccaceae bacterium]|nr:Lrp/AsnC family transcriptional regulator [Paracoccaceae bacterium]
MDQIDRRLLDALQHDASLSLDALGDKAGLSRNATWRRLRALEEAGVIRGRVALLDAEKLGLGLAVFIQIKTSRHDPAWLESFARATRDMPEIVAAYRMSGDLDYLVHARVADMAEYDALYQRLIRKVSMNDVSASFVMEELKSTTALPIKEGV